MQSVWMGAWVGGCVQDCVCICGQVCVYRVCVCVRMCPGDARLPQTVQRDMAQLLGTSTLSWLH
jgi:hypothetical protein